LITEHFIHRLLNGIKELSDEIYKENSDLLEKCENPTSKKEVADMIGHAHRIRGKIDTLKEIRELIKTIITESDGKN